MRLGFVGVGKWATKLAAAFRACGAEIVAHDRRQAGAGFIRGANGHCVSTEPEDFGVRMPWRDQLADKSIDAIIAVATPEITTEVALACAGAGKPVMATKPLFDHPETIRSVFYVDFWRLWSADYLAARDAFRGALARDDMDDARRFAIELFGSGPFREFPGSLDYGPHVVAMLMDLIGSHGMALDKATRLPSSEGELFNVEWIGHGDRLNFRACFGNGACSASRSFGHPGQRVHEDGLLIGSEEKSAVLQRFCQSFMNDVSEGFVDTRLLNLSRDGMRELRKIREMAT